MGSAKKKKNDNLFQSISCGWDGFCHCVKKERHIQVGLVITLLVVICGFLFRVELMEWIAILLCILFVLSLEMLNTAIEVTVDIAMPNIHPLAKIAKDVSAASVVLSLLISAIIGLLIFVPKIIALFV